MPPDDSQAPRSVSPGLVEKLSILLEQARRGEVTGFAGVVFMRHGATNLWSALPHPEDRAPLLAALEELKQMHGAGGTGSDT